MSAPAPRLMPAGLASAYLKVLAPPALLAPIPLFLTGGASPAAVVLYEVAVFFLWARARSGRPIRVADLVLNVAGLGYFAWLAFEVGVLRHGLLRSVSHLLLFTAVAKLASLKTPGEARTALLVLFLLTLGSASSSTHVSSLLYFAAMGLVAFRALGRIAVLADFAEAPPDRVLRSVPTRGLVAAGFAGAALLGLPLFYGLPRLRGPYAIAPFRLDDPSGTAVRADRVELEAFGSAKRSDRVVLRLKADPADWNRVLRLREAVFTEYRRGVWTRGLQSRSAPWAPFGESVREGPGSISIDLNLAINGFLFLPYDTASLRIEGRLPILAASDGVLRLPPSGRAISYDLLLGPPGPVRGRGTSGIAPGAVPSEIRDYAARIAGDRRDPAAIYRAIHVHLQKDFVYTLDPPAAAGDPLIHFLLRSRAGHCEFFASAAALMLASRGIPARLVTGSYGGEVGFFSRTVVVRGGNLHAWVEADLDGSGFSVLDPTPPVGVPEASSRGSMLRRLAGLGRELEFFYDRRILGFEALDQIRMVEAARRSLAGAAESASGWKSLASFPRPSPRFLVGVGLLAGAALLLWTLRRRARALPRTTRAYLELRELLARRAGSLSPATPPAEVARLFGHRVPAAGDDARAVVTLYCASAFGGRPLDAAGSRDLSLRLRRLRKLA